MTFQIQVKEEFHKKSEFSYRKDSKVFKYSVILLKGGHKITLASFSVDDINVSQPPRDRAENYAHALSTIVGVTYNFIECVPEYEPGTYAVSVCGVTDDGRPILDYDTLELLKRR